MGHKSHPPYPVHEGLSSSRPSTPDPFSEQFIQLPFAAMIEATSLLWKHMISYREATGFTKEDSDAIVSIERRLKALREKDQEWRRARDLVLRCLHPDGCYFQHLDKEFVRKLYELVKCDIVRGVAGLPLNNPEMVVKLAEMLKTEVERLPPSYHW
jgi:hypothetical protein